MGYFIVLLTPTPTPSGEVGEIAAQTERVIDSFNSLGFGMATMFVITILALVMLMLAWSGRNNSNTALTTLASVNQQKDKDITDLKAQRAAEHQQFMDSLSALHDQHIRLNDLQAQQNQILKTQTERDTARDAKTEQIATEVRSLSERGGQHAAEILRSVQANADQLARIDMRTTSWDAVVQIVTPLLQELQALRLEAKKHSTKPIPAVDTNGLTTETEP